MLECAGLHVRYGPIHAVAGCDIVVPTGTIAAVLGANGAGKSSLMKAVAGLVPAAQGRIRIDGEDVTEMPAHQRARRGISLALEGRRLFHRLTVLENLRVAWEFRNRGGSFDAAVDRAFGRFPMLATRRNTHAGLLSGGQQQMVILSAALIHKPRYLLLDEPSLGLAPVIVQQIFEAIDATCREDGTTILLSEQVVAVALSVARRAYVLKSGRVVREGDAGALAGDRSLSAAYLGG
jgi:branched-chain amino acid transport system ATP-binding protein